MCFDGRLLHAAPSDLRAGYDEEEEEEEDDDEDEDEEEEEDLGLDDPNASYRCTFLVNSAFPLGFAKWNCLLRPLTCCCCLFVLFLLIKP